MNKMRTALALAASIFLALAGTAPARADNYVVRDGLGALQTFCSKLVSTTQYQCPVLYGYAGGAPVAINVDPSTGNLIVNANQTGTWTVGINTAIPAGTNLLGKVGIDQTTPGTTNGVQINAGAALIGKVGIDQTTPGTTNLMALISGQNGVAAGSGTVSASTQRMVLATDVALPAGANLLGKTGIDQTTPGTTNGVVDAATSATGSAVPAKASYIGANGSGNLVGRIQADGSVKIDISTATTTQLVALSSSKKIYVTHWDVISAGAGNIKLVYGTGSACGTGTTDLTGSYTLTGQAGISAGGGLGPVLVVPASNALCATTSAAVQMSGAVSYTQF